MLKGFSKLSKEDKIRFLAEILPGELDLPGILTSFHHPDHAIQKRLDEISENTLSNYILPFNIAPNFLINGKEYNIPMVIEESSVVAAASAGAKFWAGRGGFHTEVIDDLKFGQIHFCYSGPVSKLTENSREIYTRLKESVKPLTERMETRGGGIVSMELKDFSSQLTNYFQIFVSFRTADSMGANFINSCLEKMSQELKDALGHSDTEIIMSILSNYNDRCLVKAFVKCPLSQMDKSSLGIDGDEFLRRFKLAVDIARVDVYRAVTHNKGIMNGVDAVVLATGNDFRAVEAAIHAWASHSGQYRGLSSVSISGKEIEFSFTIPLSLGTVGGLTQLHPLAQLALKILGNPDAKELMMVAASAGLANHFSAVRSLVTSGIQKGHMKLHLQNILNSFHATEEEKKQALSYFKERTVQHSDVRDFIETLRSGKAQ